MVASRLSGPLYQEVPMCETWSHDFFPNHLICQLALSTVNDLPEMALTVTPCGLTGWPGSSTFVRSQINVSVRSGKSPEKVAVCDSPSGENSTGKSGGRYPIKFTHTMGARGSDGIHDTCPISSDSTTSRSVDMVSVGTG